MFERWHLSRWRVHGHGDDHRQTLFGLLEVLWRTARKGDGKTFARCDQRRENSVFTHVYLMGSFGICGHKL